MDQKTEQRIRQRAYDLWVAFDKPEGSHLRFWTDAEKQILSEIAEGSETADKPGEKGDEV